MRQPNDIDTYVFADDGSIPNSPLPVLVYEGVPEAQDAAACEELFARHAWLGALCSCCRPAPGTAA